jgi:hypothetical protein
VGAAADGDVNGGFPRASGAGEWCALAGKNGNQLGLPGFRNEVNQLAFIVVLEMFEVGAAFDEVLYEPDQALAGGNFEKVLSVFIAAVEGSAVVQQQFGDCEASPGEAFRD